MNDFKDRPLGQLSYVEELQMNEIKKLKSIISHLVAIIECYRQETIPLHYVDNHAVSEVKNDL